MNAWGYASRRFIRQHEGIALIVVAAQAHEVQGYSAHPSICIELNLVAASVKSVSNCRDTTSSKTHACARRQSYHRIRR